MTLLKAYETLFLKMEAKCVHKVWELGLRLAGEREASFVVRLAYPSAGVDTGNVYLLGCQQVVRLDERMAEHGRAQTA